MSVSTFIHEVEDTPPGELLDWPDFSRRLVEAFGASKTTEERGQLLAVRALATERVVRELNLDSDQLEKFTDVCELEYKRLVVQETLVGGVVSYQELLHVTDREMAAGRMSDEYALRALALEEAAASSPVQSPELKSAPSALVTRLEILKRWLHLD